MRRGWPGISILAAFPHFWIRFTETAAAPRPSELGNFPADPRCGSATAQPSGSPRRALAGESSPALQPPPATVAAVQQAAPPPPPNAPALALQARHILEPPESLSDRISTPKHRIQAAPANRRHSQRRTPQNAAGLAGRGAGATAPCGYTARNGRRRAPVAGRRFHQNCSLSTGCVEARRFNSTDLQRLRPLY